MVKAECKTSDSDNEPIVLIHGTHATNAPWWRPGSAFCRLLDSALEQRGSKARCWRGLEVLAETFAWGGDNSERERRLAALDLSSRLLAITDKQVHIVAHSHGGNVAAIALGLIRSNKVVSFTALGTPFFEHKRIELGPSRKRSASWVIF
jgi:pimeloyl-ACP methyl ester carboxylesterase